MIHVLYLKSLLVFQALVSTFFLFVKVKMPHDSLKNALCVRMYAKRERGERKRAVQITHTVFKQVNYLWWGWNIPFKPLSSPWLNVPLANQNPIVPSSIIISMCASADWPSLHGIPCCKAPAQSKARMGLYKLALYTRAKGREQLLETLPGVQKKKMKRYLDPFSYFLSLSSERQSGFRSAWLIVPCAAVQCCSLWCGFLSLTQSGAHCSPGFTHTHTGAHTHTLKLRLSSNQIHYVNLDVRPH